MSGQVGRALLWSLSALLWHLLALFGTQRRVSGSLQVAELSKGAFGCVLLAKDKETGANLALKFIPRGPEVREEGPGLTTQQC